MATPSDPDAFAAQVVALTESRSPTLGAGRLICIDGLAGSGKSTLATRIGALRPDAVVLGTDDMLAGWRGLSGLGATLDELLQPLGRGEVGHWRRWDWGRSDWAEQRSVAPTDLLVLEGVGSASSPIRDLITATVWLEADRDVRLARGLTRDGESLRADWLTWLGDEEAHHARERTREGADLRVDTATDSGWAQYQ